ncbi:MAG: phosphoglycerate dehydrogenase [Armatimonadetes bacterium]|nr:MAG: phosphoglycerate dehydrogenase [Armatimonadota bacterium]
MSNDTAQPRRKVIVAEAIAEAGISTLEAECDVIDLVGADRSTVLASLGDAAALIVRSATQVDREMIEAGPFLEVIGRAGIGVDNIDLDAATEHGVLVVNAPNANTISAAEHTMALLLAQARRVAEADHSLREGRWDRKLFQGMELHGKTLGILGLGKIGTLVAQRASSFGMHIIAYDPYISPERARRLGVVLLPLDAVFATADVLTVHLPRTADTENIINAESIATMKDGVRIINVARGGIVNEADLADALLSGKCGGAAVDVFDTEPTTDSPLFGIPQVTVTPHLGASTKEAQDKAGIAVAHAVAEALTGQLVLSAVNLDLGPTVSAEVKPFLALAEQLGRIFVVHAKGLPSELVVTAKGHLAHEPVRPLALSALKGALAGASDGAVSYVNAPLIAAAKGVTVVEEAQPDVEDYQSVIRLSGFVGGRERTVAGTFMSRKGAVLVGIDDYAVEVPLTHHMLLVRNDDSPGCIGRVGTYLGDLGHNIADMVVGRSSNGTGAMMGIALEAVLDAASVEGIRGLDGIAAVRYIELP